MINWKRCGPSVIGGPARHSWPDMPEGLPVDILPASNEEYFPPPPSREQIGMMRLAEEETERWRRKLGMSRAQFVRTAAAMAIGFWAIDRIRPGIFGSYDALAHDTATTDACDLEWAGRKGLETLNNLPGEFIFDVQSHHVDPDGLWRVDNPAIHAFFAAVWPQASPVTGGKPSIGPGGYIRGGGAGEIDPIQNLSRFHYLKEIYLDSATSASVLSVVPTSPDTDNPLPIAEASETVDTVNSLAKPAVIPPQAPISSGAPSSGAHHATSHSHHHAAHHHHSAHPHAAHHHHPQHRQQSGQSKSSAPAPSGKPQLDSQRTVMHAFVMPNRGSAGTANTGQAVPAKPLYFDEEMQLMATRAAQHRDKLRGWKTYCAWGDVPYASGWFLDSDIGMEFLANVVRISDQFPEIPPVVATHKGFALPGFDQRCATPRDIGGAAKQNPKVRFLVYHSGYDIGDTQKPYRGDAMANSNSNTVDGLIKSLREHQYDATRFIAPGRKFGNVPNVWAELGSVWRSVMDDPDQAAHLLGKLITYVGPKRICWGTDSLWYGSPQKEIVGLRRFEFTERGKELYALPYGMEGDREDPTQPAPGPERTIRNAIFGYNAADAYNFDPSFRSQAIRCDQVQKLKDEGYIQGHGLAQTASLRMNAIPGPRTRREVMKSLTENPWSP
jgi:predicted TIM-barrel fold metal-dependent hydrolase